MIAVAFIVVLALIISILAVFLIKKSEAIKKVKEEWFLATFSGLVAR